MNFILFEHSDGSTSFSLVNNSITIPKDVIAFTHYVQSPENTTGKISYSQYRIGIPVKITINNMYTEINKEDINDTNYKNLFCLYIKNNQEHFVTLSRHLTLVNNYQELELAFYKEIQQNIYAKRKR